ncbi:MAG TPA: Rpn family recombination-promoting nuclease/putative transposase [Kofleriaceae bacterium]|jgi:predicted transposase/invertase (TIGR01784 family)|nr:Rpn family recombination-promoting nuclease/putative transposase [Kofleriaceae bacterium]
MLLTPHDALFKAVFGQPEHARGTLRAVVPSALAEALDWATLTLRPGSFVDAALTHQHTDLLYSATWREGGEALVYFLFEHQSTPPTEALMALRLLRYQDRIWDRWRIDHPKARMLPVILPIVMYHGMTPWPEPRSFDALLDIPAGVRAAVEPYLVRFTYVLHDLSEISDDQLRESAMSTALAKLVAMCFKHARTSADFVQILRRWVDVMREVTRAPNGLEALAQVMRYILEVNEHVASEALQALLEREIGPEAKDTIVTAGQQLIEQGIQRGRQEGRQEGRLQGFQELLLRLLRQRFGDAVDTNIEQRIATASVEQIEIWSGRVLSTTALAEVFAG